MRIQHRILLCCDPIPDIPADKKERKKKQHHPGHQSRQIFHLAPDDNTPPRICRMMNNDPEKAADQNGEEVEEGKQPRERELFAQFAAGGRGKTDNERDQQAGSPDSQERQQEPVDVSALKNLRSWERSNDRGSSLLSRLRCLRFCRLLWSSC